MTDTRPLDLALFGEAAIDAETAKLNAQMIEQLTAQPEWWVVGPQAMPAARRQGSAGLGAAIVGRASPSKPARHNQLVLNFLAQWMGSLCARRAIRGNRPKECS